MAEPASSEKSTRLTIYAAFAANIGIAAAKFVAALLSGSSSMLSEGFHSVVDSTNQILILLGEKRSKRPPDTEHPLGYGREIYFWSFVVALLIFATGAGLSIYEGVVHIRSPEPLSDPTLNYVVLGFAFVFEGASWFLARRHFGRAKGGLGWIEAIEASKDPPDFIVLIEDSAALCGLLIAAVGIFLSHRLQMPWLDGAASILIGLLLAGVAILLAREAHGLLIGERADPALTEAIRRTVEEREEIAQVVELLSLHVAPEEIVIAMRVSFVTNERVGASIPAIEAEIRRRWPSVGRVYITPSNAAPREGKNAERGNRPGVIAR